MAGSVQAQKINLPPVRRVTLENGIRVVLMEYHKAPTLSVTALAMIIAAELGTVVIGGLIDQQALIAALRKGTLAGAGLDVTVHIGAAVR